MESRLTLIFEKLEKAVNDARQLYDLAETEPIALQEFLRTKFLLRQTLNLVNSEIQKYISQCSSELVTRGTNAQLSAEDILASIEASIITTQSQDSNTHFASNHCKLPKLQLPKFAGDLLKWHEFWDRFESTVHTRNLSGADKLAYLIGSLEGSALESVEGLAVTNANYSIALDTLKSRYGKTDTLIDAHYDALLKLPQAGDTPSECRNTLNIIERHLRVLHSLGEQTDGNHLRITLLRKFPDKVVYEVSAATKDNSVNSVRLTLEHIISAMERSHRTRGDIHMNPPVPSITTESLLITSHNNKHKFKFDKNNRKRKNFTPSISQKRSRIECVFCKGDHYNSDCTKFNTVGERKRLLGKKCYRCFREGHNIRTCKIKKNCFYCKGDHNQALCPRKIGIRTERVYETYNFSHVPNQCSFLQTATVIVKNQNNEVKCRVLLDSGSQRSYITTQTANKLKLVPDNDDLLMIFTFGSDKPKETSSPSAEIIIDTKRGIQRKIRVNMVPHIIKNSNLPTVKINHLVDIPADDRLAEKIDLLIGNDYYFSFMRTEKIKIQDNLFVVDSDFGWVITCHLNYMEREKENVLSIITYCRSDESHYPYYTEPDLPLRDMDMRFLWALESIGICDSIKATREEEAIQHFNETVRYVDQRYQVKWPWIHNPPELPNNFGLAMGRLINLVRRLDQETLKEYNNILQEQLKVGVIEIVPPSQNTNKSPLHYLPHHLVQQEGKRSRIVYDASAKIKMQKSLNECLYRGPTMIEDLNALLLSFRTNKVAILADVEKAFLQVGLQADDRDVTRFLWLKDITKGTIENNILYLRFCRVPFGIISSPFLLTATIRYHLLRKEDAVLAEMANKCYVDNLVTGTSSTDKAKELYTITRKAFQEMSMNIREWISNDRTFLDWIPKQHQASNTKQTKVLGLLWNVLEDTLQIKLKESIFTEEHNKNSKNKREILRTIASFFDPCGFVSPLILPAKLLLQELWLRKLDWDSPLPEELEKKWINIIKNLEVLRDIRIPRYIGYNIKINKDTKFELHCFTDASEKAYAAVTYLRIIGFKNIRTVLIMSKSRVTPVKQKPNLNIPRLELVGYTIGSRLLTYVKNSLGLSIHRQYLWTDSNIVLCWMKSNKLLHPFVARRVNEIKQNKNTDWRYVNTNVNPADIATRPEKWYNQEELWYHGPQFLLNNPDSWPSASEVSTFCAAGESLVTTFPEDHVLEIEEEQEVCAKIPNEPDDSVLSEVNLIKKLQEQYYPDEVSGKQTNLSRNLGLFMDVDGLLRCQGRMAHTSWDYDMKHPVLIPIDCNFTKRVIQEIHEKNYHVGVSHTLSILRQRYWVPKGRLQVQKVIHKCQRCVKHGGGPYSLPPTPDLPTERVNYSAPYTYTGIDYFGPLYVKTNSGNEKRWVCLMTCLAVRAVHMEVVADLTAEECLQAIRRFIASKGVPTLIVSDNALQFKLSAEILESTICIKNKIKWKFIPQLAPWNGGFYERLIGVVKQCLKKTLDKHLLTNGQLLTVIKEIEAVINTRPLTYVSSEYDYILKPADFLSMGKCIVTEPAVSEQTNFTETTVTKRDIIEGWKRGNIVLEEYKRMFVNRYLLGLRERYNNSVKQPRIKSKECPRLGDIVQIKGDSKNRDLWKVGKIVSLIKGSDGACRIARVKVGSTELIRSLGHLYPLEVEETTNTEENVEAVTDDKGHNGDSLDPSINYMSEDLCGLQLNPFESRDTEQNTKEIEIQQAEFNHIPQILAQDSNEQINSEIDKELEVKSRDVEVRTKRDAAIKAREKIAEWTRQLAAVFLVVGSVAEERDS